jgi:hypothetical protein
MLQKLPFLIGLILVVSLTSLTARAQDKIELFGGYSYQHYDGIPSGNLNGWEISGQYKVARWLGGVADLGAHYGSPSGIDTGTVTYLFGPQVSFPAPISPFVHVLIGGAHIREGGITDTSFSTAFGGGIDMRVAPFLSWRIFQGDVVNTGFFGGTQHNARVSTGIVFRF